MLQDTLRDTFPQSGAGMTAGNFGLGKEYGGYLPLELPLLKRGYYDEYKESLIALNCGRSAIYCALKNADAKKVFLPYYNCISVTEGVEASGVKYEYYRLDDRLMPVDVKCADGEYILWVNYFGNAKESAKLEILDRYKNVIFDNTQAFFSKPIIEQYNIYSCRKFFGVSDGAYLIKNKIKQIALRQDVSHERALYLLKSIETGSNAAYEHYLESEGLFGDNILLMSQLTRRILESIDYEKVKKIRRDNFNVLHRILGESNKFAVNTLSDTHIAYPFLSKYEKLRDVLIKNKVYVSAWWKHVPQLVKNQGIETQMSNCLIPLPIDQRYGEEDMERIASLVLNNERQAGF